MMIEFEPTRRLGLPSESGSASWPALLVAMSSS
jgi:hypothetical protein